MITNEVVEQVCDEVSGYTDDRMMTEFDRFFKEQPAICDFIVELTSDSSSQIQELSLFLSYMVYKTLSAGRPDNKSEVTIENIEAAYKEAEQWIDSINESQETAPDSESPLTISDDSEPYLIQYVISELNQPLEDGAVLGDEDRGEIFFVLKTVISSLARSTFGKETRKQSNE